MPLPRTLSMTVTGAVLVLVASLSTPTHATGPLMFSDIADTMFSAEIMWLADEGITRGCDSDRFCPNNAVTREQMASFIARAMKLPAANRDYFTDDNDSPHEADINRLAAAGISSGCTATRFCPKDNVTRAQMASFLARALKLPPSGTNFFDDDDGNLHENQINALAASRITGGCATRRYCPNLDVTRGQMAAFLYRTLRDRSNPGPIATPSPSVSPSSTFVPSPADEPSDPSSPVAFGAYVAGAASDESEIDRFTELVGVQPSVLMWYQSWDSEYNAFPLVTVKAADERGMRPIVTWDPAAGDFATSAACRLASIWGGDHDAYLRTWAQSARDWGAPVYVRFGHEMNGNWKCWSVGLSGNDDGDFVRAWRYLVDLFRDEGASNVRWVWSPNVAYDERSAQFHLFYPGDDFVDWIGLDGYNWGPADEWHSWKSFTEVFVASYDALARLSPRPMMIAEMASTEVGGDKSAWIESAFQAEVPDRFPLVRAIVWFHEDKEQDWRVNSSAAALASYRHAAENPYYGGSLP